MPSASMMMGAICRRALAMDESVGNELADDGVADAYAVAAAV